MVRATSVTNTSAQIEISDYNEMSYRDNDQEDDSGPQDTDISQRLGRSNLKNARNITVSPHKTGNETSINTDSGTTNNDFNLSSKLDKLNRYSEEDPL